MRRIVCTPTFAIFVIDRHAAVYLSLAGRGDYSKCLLSQLTAVLRTRPLGELQCQTRPWKVTFAGELAVDAGGPARELVTETAASIFDPPSQLVIPAPNNRRGAGFGKDTFLPSDPFARRKDDMRTIGHYLGIVLRSGLSQNLPFAPLVWRYLAGEKLRADDIFEIDDVFRDRLDFVAQSAANGAETWIVEDWAGETCPLPGHNPGVRVKPGEVDRYISECIRFRIRRLKTTLKVIRDAFRQNIGFGKLVFLSGAVLSRMIQGSDVVTLVHLKAITQFKGYSPNDPLIGRFWAAIERFTAEQLKLFLKFVTTLTRLPNPSINPKFLLVIDRLAVDPPDQALPTASTCFNLLHLPPYSDAEACYQKLLYAVQFCQTMEEK
jgi:hypothetical protein